MKRIIERYVRKRMWMAYEDRIFGGFYSELDDMVQWIMDGYPFHWHARLWAATHCGCHDAKKAYEWLFKRTV